MSPYAQALISAVSSKRFLSPVFFRFVSACTNSSITSDYKMKMFRFYASSALSATPTFTVSISSR